jgi:hypothetical protein
VRRKIYSSSVGKWKLYEQKLKPFAEAISEYLQAYESKYPSTQSDGHEEL